MLQGVLDGAERDDLEQVAQLTGRVDARLAGTSATSRPSFESLG